MRTRSRVYMRLKIRERSGPRAKNRRNYEEKNDNEIRHFRAVT